MNEEPGDLAERVPLEKRGNVREPTRRPVRVEIPPLELKGLTRDVSASGAFVLAAQELDVRCRIDGEADVRLGRIVRLEQLPGGGVGLAIEFGP